MTTSIPSNTSKSESRGFFTSRPWLWVVFAFVMLFSAWTALFYIAMNNQPESIPLKHLMP